MGPESALPLPAEFNDVEAFVQSLLEFTTSSWLLQTLCGGVHILDFYTRSPDLYSTLIPESWRTWLDKQDIMDILHLLTREDLDQFELEASGLPAWQDDPPLPKDFVQYIKNIRKHLLAREFAQKDSALQSKIPRHVALGMNVKKVHEVHNFARYIDKLTSEINEVSKRPITHLVDFGSGQNYLGRALGALPYSKRIVAVESKQKNIQGAKNMDTLAHLVQRPLIMRNKKEYRNETGTNKKGRKRENSIFTGGGCKTPHAKCSIEQVAQAEALKTETSSSPDMLDSTTKKDLQVYKEGGGSVQYVQHVIKDGDLTSVLNQITNTSNPVVENAEPTLNSFEHAHDPGAIPKAKEEVNAMVISLHSCGNLVHHGLRSLLLNSQVSAVAMVGCCYNLMTERLGPPTYKLPVLRPNHPRIADTSNASDPNGFPMSDRLAFYPLPYRFTDLINDYDLEDEVATSEHKENRGVRLNITARMMAVQALFNWGREDSELFFTRHFYRALLQRIFFDRGVISAPVDNFPDTVSANGHTSSVNWTPPSGRGPGLSSDGSTAPLTIGTLRKFAYSSFVSYVRAAIDKLTSPNSFCEVDSSFIQDKMEGLTEEDIKEYERKYAKRKKELSIMWSLMAFSAGVVESVIVVDRWLWLTEQNEVAKAWVEPVFEYKYSPRNLVVVGIKKESKGESIKDGIAQ